MIGVGINLELQGNPSLRLDLCAQNTLTTTILTSILVTTIGKAYIMII